MNNFQPAGLILLLLIPGLFFLDISLKGEKPPLHYGKCQTEVDCSLYNPNQANVKVTKGAIYLDLSQSMQGYISDKNVNIPFTLLQHILHNVLQTSFHHIDISKYVFKGFGRHITDVNVPMKYYAIKTRNKDEEIPPRSRYNLKETNIVGVLSKASQCDSTFSVIITDGLQDVQGINGELAPGFDRPEFIQAICKGLVQKGFGVWLIGIMNSFDGFYYNIIPNRDGEINRPFHIKATRRPVYCWIISKDIAKGRKFLQYFYRDLSRLAENYYPKEKDLVQVIEIAPGICPKITLAEPEPEDYFELDDKTSASLTFVVEWGTHPDRKTTNVATASFSKAGGSTVRFVVQAKLESKKYDWNCFPSKMWQIGLRNPKSFPMTMTSKTPATQNNAIKDLRFIFLSFHYERLVVFNAEDRVIELPVYFYADLDVGLETSWLKEWSTIIDSEEKYVQGKTLYLYDVISEILKHTVGKERNGACLHLALIKRNG